MVERVCEDWVTLSWPRGMDAFPGVPTTQWANLCQARALSDQGWRTDPCVLKHRPHAPGDEFMIAHAHALALGLPAGGGVQNRLEDLFPHLLDSSLAVGDFATVDVHILLHVLIHAGI